MLLILSLSLSLSISSKCLHSNTNRELSGASPAKVSDAERKRLARERQNAILAKFASQQKAFKGSGVFEMGDDEEDKNLSKGTR